jgi:ADP-ribosyl-[dinitrogen reductase] hydrolase
MQRCTFCRTEIGSVHWAFDGVSEQPVPACRECCDRLRLKVWKVEVKDGAEGADLPVRADCVHCGIPLPSDDTRPVIVWVRGEHGVDAVCNACRIRYGRVTQFVTLPDADWGDTDWPQDNAALLRQLLAENAIDLRCGELLDRPPAPLPAAPAATGASDDARASTWDRVEGMLLGIAVGDALGNTSEGMTPADRRARYGEVRDYIPHWRSKQLGRPTDDTQLAFWTLDQLLVDRGLTPHRLARRFASERIFGIGSAVSQAMQAVRLGYRPWYQCGTRSAGNGALMRIAPMLVPYLREPSTDLWADTALSAIVTHNDAASTSACLAFVAMLWDLLGMQAPPEPGWWRRRYVELARDLEGETEYEPRGGAYRGYRGPLWRFVDERLADAESRGLTVLEACDEWYSGAYLLETVPSVLYILARHGADPEEAMVRAVNDTKDNDTIAAIVGAASGALHGASALPARWVDQLPGYTRANDDGEVQRIIARARERWG